MLWLVCMVFLASAVSVRYWLQQRGAAALRLLAGLATLLAWLLYPRLPFWLLPWMPDAYGMACYAALVGLQLGLTDAVVKTWLARRQRADGGKEKQW
ncbi:hypothetical protein BUE93_00965 [Chromobacterium amazonense]|uniref:Uncharacterized protein n=1 Tax=Chromobacterium amazonense TaxID=1382803 RepID=A0A2S9XA72_9NEIS|nr:hypothetical protein [Chromobacterium amazonense]PRP72632.1 hypothetical protein BUE93_00965 [Chromobacterium amazonense]